MLKTIRFGLIVAAWEWTWARDWTWATVRACERHSSASCCAGPLGVISPNCIVRQITHVRCARAEADHTDRVGVAWLDRHNPLAGCFIGHQRCRWSSRTGVAAHARHTPFIQHMSICDRPRRTVARTTGQSRSHSEQKHARSSSHTGAAHSALHRTAATAAHWRHLLRGTSCYLRERRLQQVPEAPRLHRRAFLRLQLAERLPRTHAAE